MLPSGMIVLGGEANAAAVAPAASAATAVNAERDRTIAVRRIVWKFSSPSGRKTSSPDSGGTSRGSSRAYLSLLTGQAAAVVLIITHMLGEQTVKRPGADLPPSLAGALATRRAHGVNPPARASLA